MKSVKANGGRLLRRLGLLAPRGADVDDRLARLEVELQQLREAQASTGAAHATWLSDIQAGIQDIHGAIESLHAASASTSATVEAQARQLADSSDWLASTVLAVTQMSTVPVLPTPSLQAGAHAQPLDRTTVVERQQRVMQVMAWLAQDPYSSDAVVSVIMPTRNRRAFLERAVQSVLSQRHQAFELVVIDDGSTDGTAAFLDSLTDPRVVKLCTAGVGGAAARNLGLDRATGAIITFLDDDNLMHPGWLHAVTWAFARWPDHQLLYGARLIEDAPAREGRPSGAMPSMEFQPFDRKRLEQMNYIDMNTLAFRAGLPGARFDEELFTSLEWDLSLVLTAANRPLELPVIACYYGTSAPDRIADNPLRLKDGRTVRARVHRTRPMRILCHNELFPLVSETYIHEEMRALAANGADIGFAAARKSVSPYPIDEPLWHDLDEAVKAHDPDLLFLYWVTHAAHELPNLERYGRPFALRVHSFDFDVEAISRLQAHPLCAGVWAYPLQAAQLEGVHGLAPIFQSHRAMPEPATLREAVASISAGLPKKNFPLLLEAMDRLPAVERHIVVARSNGEEQAVDDLEREIAARPEGPRLHVNLPRADVFNLLARTSATVYTVHDGVKMGMPMSIIEAMRAGCCVVHVDREEIRQVTGESWRPYRTAADIVRHVQEILAGGPAIEAERQRNRAFAEQHFCDPGRGEQFHREVADAVEAWRLRVG